MRKIGIVVIATNAYFALGVKFLKQFTFFNTGHDKVTFYFFSDTDPAPYLPNDPRLNVKYIPEHHKRWADGTNSKFKNILTMEDEDLDYIYYFDADTSVSRPFTTDWFIGELVGGEHFGNRTWMRDKKAFDRNPRSKSYVPYDTPLKQMYYYGAFFGGEKDRVLNFCKTLREWQLIDKEIPYEPGVNDESYINAYFHYNPPFTVEIEEFVFNISDKSGVGETRNPHLSIETIKKDLLENKDNRIDIKNGKVERIT